MTVNFPISIDDFGALPNGRRCKLFTLRNANGVSASITDFGATLTSFISPDREGQLADIVLGFDNVAGYYHADAYMGAMVGRFANRIAAGRFELHGKRYQLDVNNGPNHLHGGNEGFDMRIWHAEALKNNSGVRFSLFSPDGDQGYPGNLTIHVLYRLSEDNELSIKIDANTDQPTPISLTNHSYFNLAGRGSITDHWLQIPATHFTPLDKNQIPTGDILPVAGTPLDFRKPHRLGERIDDAHEQIDIGSGYDHNFVTGATLGGERKIAAILEEKHSGRVLELSTNAPGLQVYTANFLDASTEGKGMLHKRRHAVCLEPQNFPDAVNKPTFPSSILSPGNKYHGEIALKVRTQD